MKEGNPLVFRGREIDWTDSQRHEVSHQPRRRDARCDDHHPPDDEEFATSQFYAGFQPLKEDIDSKNENQHYEDNSDRKMVPGEVGTTNMKIVVRSREALTYHSAHTDEHTPQCESSMSKMCGLWKILGVRCGKRSHRRRVSESLNYT